MTTETEAAIEFTTMHLEKVLPGAMHESKVEIQIRLEILRGGLLEPMWPTGHDEMNFVLLVRRAQNGDTRTDEQLRVAAIMLLEDGRPLPTALSQYVADILRAALPRKHKLANRRRDEEICFCVKLLVEQGFQPTRNVASRGGEMKSACSIVRAALERIGVFLSEDAIEKIWQKSGDLLGALKPSVTPRKTKPTTLDEWHRRQRDETISLVMEIEGDAILAELGRCPDADGEWSEDDVAALRAECEKRVMNKLPRPRWPLAFRRP